MVSRATCVIGADFLPNEPYQLLLFRGYRTLVLACIVLRMLVLLRQGPAGMTTDLFDRRQGRVLGELRFICPLSLHL